MSTDAHKCPISGCPLLVEDRYVMCRGHWRQVPPDLQTAVWRAYHRKNVDALRVAQNDAVRSVNGRKAA